ncbi:recombinase family protein [Streptomyces sp. NPDC059909]|uniref:recombinase family protein n=1 Tax=Streptomyces sp. NPDC059909 TaxID=3346998 RepID=UPI003650991B
MLLGYCRTSTAEQNPDHQIDALLRNGVDRGNIHVDVASGAKSSRPKLDLLTPVTVRRRSIRPIVSRPLLQDM